MRKVTRPLLSSIPTASGGIARAAYARLVRAKLEVEPLLKRAGLTMQEADNPAIRISVSSQIKFLDLAAGALQDEFLGMRLAQELDLRELGLLFYVPASCDTLGAALRNLARYSAIYNEGVRIRYREGRIMSVVFEYADVVRRHDRHQVEFFAVTLLRICRQLAGYNLRPMSVKFTHHRTGVAPDCRRVLCDSVAFGNSVDEVTFPISAARAPIASADPYLNSLLIGYCNEIVRGRRTKSSIWRARVENTVAALLPHDQTHMPEVAKRLGVSQRTLARRLKEEGVTFARILDELRCDLAKRYLKERGLPISEVAWLLGYREVSAFHHAFRRWTGRTPSRYAAGVS